MLHITLLAIGRIKENYLKQGIYEYRKRLNPYLKLNIRELPDAPLGKEPDKAKETEGERILNALKDNSYVMVFDPGGKEMSSEEFASWLGDREMAGKEVIMVIGGASGVSKKVLEKAHEKISFSRLTFPHQLFRLIVLEQIYRAYKILRGEPYHL